MSITSTLRRFLLVSIFTFIAGCWADDPTISFDRKTGILSISSASDAIQCGVSERGFVEFSSSHWSASSDPTAANYAATLAGIDSHDLRGITMTGAVELFLSDISTSDTLAINAESATLRGKLSAKSIAIHCRNRLVIDATATLSARESRIALAAPIIISGGRIDVSGDRAGQITIEAANVFNHATLLADGTTSAGRIAISFSGKYVETQEARLWARGTTCPGGQIEINGGSTGDYFTSGSLDVTATTGGTIQIVARRMDLAAAHFNASGDFGGGAILLGCDADGGKSSGMKASVVGVNPFTTIAADALVNGRGGRIVVWSESQTEIAGTLSARGGPNGGDGGFIEASGKDKLGFSGTGDAAAPRGERGQLLLDPKFIVISNSGALPQFTFNNPDTAPANGDQFGSGAQNNVAVTPLDSGNVLVTHFNDHTGGNQAGAIRLYNGNTGALICSYLGATNDRLGAGVDPNFGQTTYTKTLVLPSGNAVVLSTFWSTNKGAATWINKNGFTSGAVNSTNSIVGSTNNDFNGATLTLLNNGNYIVSTPFWSGGGASTWVNGSTGIGLVADGTIGSSLSLTGNGMGTAVFVLPTGNSFVACGSNCATFCTGPMAGAVTNSNSFLIGGLKHPSFFHMLTNGNFTMNTFTQTLQGANNITTTLFNGTTGRVGNADLTNTLFINNVQDAYVVPLSNSNYVVYAPDYNGNRGCAVWGSGTLGVAGVPDNTFALVGVNGNDQVANGGGGGLSALGAVVPLRNGNYVVISSNWSGGKGAVTWVNGTNGKTLDNVNTISAANSLVGTTADTVNVTNSGDHVGSAQSSVGVFEIGNAIVGTAYVVLSPYWGFGKGAATRCSSTGGTVGTISIANSMVGVTQHPNQFQASGGDVVGSQGMLVLSNGNYVIRSPQFDSQRGAITFSTFSGTLTGTLNASNSLLGATQSQQFQNNGDSIGNNYIVEVGNSNFIVGSSNFRNGGSSRGAVTWGSGTTGIIGTVSAANSIVGTTDFDSVGQGQPIVLSNGNFVTYTTQWHNGGINNAGAATWINGNTGQSMTGFGPVTSANSVVGTIPNDGNGLTVVPLKRPTNSNPNYLVVSYTWTNLNPGAGSAGAVTFCNGTTGTAGYINDTNSLVGTHGNDQVGYPGKDGICVLPNGNYVVGSRNWDNGKGAVTWGSGTTGITGPVSASNSVTGATATSTQGQGDMIGGFFTSTDIFGNPSLSTSNPVVLSNGHLVIVSPQFNNGTFVQAGAATWINGNSGQSVTGFGPIGAQNSLIGAAASTNLNRIYEDTINNGIIANFPNEGAGILRAMSSTGQNFTYAFRRSQTLTIPPSFITNTLAAGTSLTLQANDDITVSDPINVVLGGGTLTLQAGRSILINANINSNNSSLSLIANDRLANGVVNAERDTGAGSITTGGGVTITLGTGVLSAQILDGLGVTNASAGTISLNGSGRLGTIAAGSVTIGGNNTASFSGALTVNGANVTLGSLGLGTGTLNVTGNLSIAAAGQLSTTLNGTTAGTFGQLNLVGTLALGNASMVATLAPGFNVPNGSPLTIVANDAADAITGTVNGIANPAGGNVLLSGTNFALQYSGGTGNDLTLRAALNITSAASTIFFVGQSGTFTVTSMGTSASTIALQSGTFPSGVTLGTPVSGSPGTLVFSGTPAAGTVGTYPLVFRATDATDLPATQNFTLTVGQQPVFTSATSTTFTATQSNSFTVSASGPPPPTLTLKSGTLPSGVTFSAGVLSGTPASGTSGTYNLVFNANNGVGPVAGIDQAFTLTVNEPASITSAATYSFTKGIAGSFTVTTAGTAPVTLTPSNVNLPPGVSYNAGVISGTPSAAAVAGGSYSIDFTASNGIGSNATQHFVVVVNQLPAFTSGNSVSFTKTVLGTFTVTATGVPAPDLSVSGTLPAGVTFNPANGLLSGAALASATPGLYVVTFTAHNVAGPDAVQSFTLTLNQLPNITSAAAKTFTVGAFNTFTVVATGTPAPTLSGSGTMPAGITFNPVNGVLSGTAAIGTTGTYNLLFTAHNIAGPDFTQPFVLTVNEASAITSPDNVAFTTGTLSSFTVVTTGSPAPTLSLVGGTLPDGVTFSNGVLGGTPPVGSNGVYNLVFFAFNNVGVPAVQNFTLTVQQRPEITTGTTATFVVGAPGSFTVAATGTPNPTFFTNSSLPTGVSLSTAGVLSGTPSAGAGGIYNLLITAQNGVGTNATQDFTLTVNQAAAITSTGTTFTVGTTNTFTLQKSGFPAPTLSLSPLTTLPAGVSFDANTGVLSGNPALNSNGVYSLVFTATNGVGTDASVNFTLTVNQAAAFTNVATGATFIAGSPGSFTATASGTPTPTFSTASTLPSGVTLSSTGVLSGTPAIGTGGVWPLVLRLQNGVGADATQNFTLTVNQVSGISSANATTFTVGSANSFAITRTGFPVPTLSQSTNLPSGVTFDTASGVLSGNPALNSNGVYNLVFTAQNGIGANFVQNFTLTVNQAAAITSGSSATFVTGAAGSFTMTATGTPTPVFSTVSPLPSGVTLSSTGVLSGTPAAGAYGVYPLVVRAINGVGTIATQNFTLTVNQTSLITSGNAATFTVGQTNNFNVTATGFPTPQLTQVGANLPAGLTFDSASGVLSGTAGPNTAGTYNLVFLAHNGVGADSLQNFTLTVNQVAAITSADNTVFAVGTAGTFTVTRTGSPAPTLSISGATLPAGVTFNASTGVLSGTPTGIGTYLLIFTATNGVGASAVQNFTLTVNEAPAFTSANNTIFSVGIVSSFAVKATGTPAPTLTCGTLPAGLTLSSAGVLGGTPAPGTVGVYNLVIVAHNSVADVTQNFTLTINQGPAFTSVPSATFTVGTSGSHQVVATGTPTPTLTRTGDNLPAGVSFDPLSGVLSGTPAAGTVGTYNLLFTAHNSTSDASQNFTLVVNQAPKITSLNNAAFPVGVVSSFTVTATGTPMPGIAISGATLPSGVTYNASSGVLSGTPAAGTVGNYNLVFTASNGVGTPDTQIFTFTVNTAAVITSTNKATFTVGTPANFLVTTVGAPVPTVASTGTLPAGITFNPATNILGGTPSAGTAGTYTPVITAHNGIGVDSVQNFTLTINQAPTITSAAARSFSEGTTDSFTVTASAAPAATISMSGNLPTGITFVSPVLSGVAAPGTSGVYDLVFTATNGVGVDSVQNFKLTINKAPVITSASQTTFIAGTFGTFTVTAAGVPTPTISQTGGLPAGVTFNAGVISGTPAAGTGGVYPITLTAANGVGTNSVINFTLTVNQAAAVTSANNTAFTIGLLGNFTVTGSGYPAPTLSVTGTLPNGVTFVPATGALSGTPAAGTAGIYPLSFISQNGVGTQATQSFTLTVNQVSAITSANATTFTISKPNTFTLSLTGSPAPTASMTGTLPSGVSFDPATKTLSGNPAVGTGGTYSLVFTAQNNIGANAVQNFTLTVNQAPAFTSASSTIFSEGITGSFAVVAIGSPTPTLSQSGALPTGVTFSASTGVLSGTPAAGSFGDYPLVFTAQNGVGTNALANFTLSVTRVSAITSANTTTFTVGAAGSWSVTATGFPAPTLALSGSVPTGVTFNAATGVLSGTPAAGSAATYPLTFTAQNGVGSAASQSFTLIVNQVAGFSSANNATFTIGASSSFTVVPTGSPLPTLSLSGALPPGITFTPATGVLSGTPAAGTAGVYPLVFTSHNSVGADAMQNFTLTINQVSAITSVANATYTVGKLGSHTVTATGSPKPALSVAGTLPNGVTFDPATGLLEGTPAAGTAGTYPLTFTATNNVGAASSQNFTLTVNQVPAITSADSMIFIVGTGGTFTLTATGSPAPALSVTGALPGGVTFDSNTGILSGTPAAGTSGNYPITFTAANGVGTAATQAFTLIVQQTPAITSAATTTFVIGVASDFTVTTTGAPTPALSVTGTLPDGITFNPATGSLRGTPNAGTAGVYNLSFTAVNPAGNISQDFTLVIDQVAAITSASEATFVVEQASAFTITTTGSPLPTLSVAGTLPAGITFNAATGVLSGMPAVATDGTYPLTFTAHNRAGADVVQNFTLTITSGIAPVISSAAIAIGVTGTEFTYTIVAQNNPAKFSAANLPPGLTLAPGSNVITGTPSAPGTFHATLTASNGAGAGTLELTLYIGVPSAPPDTGSGIPALTSPETATGTSKSLFTYLISATNNPTLFHASGLPDGLTLNAGTGEISGAPTVSGTFTINLGAANAAGEGIGTLTLTIAPSADGLPTLTPVTVPPVLVGTPVTIALNAGNAITPVTFAATGLPTGLAIDPATGTISGAPLVPGQFTITVTATNSAGSASTALVLVVANQLGVAPIIVNGPALLGNGAVAGVPALLVCAADQDGVTFTWNFGDGSGAASGSLVSHVFVTAGTYTVMATATNLNGQSSSKTLMLNVTDLPGSTTDVDSSGNGFPNEILVALGLDPTNPAATPFGGAAAGAPGDLQITSLTASLNFNKKRADSIRLSGLLGVPAGFKSQGKKVIVDVGGVIGIFTLDAKGKSTHGLNKFAMSAKDGAPTAKFRATLRGFNGSITELLKDEQLVNGEVKNVTRTVPVVVLFDGKLLRKNQAVLFTATHDRGRARGAK